jgi:hypothetical protein
MFEDLRARLAQTADVDVSPSMFRVDDGYWVNGREVAHVSGDWLEIRLSRDNIRSQRGALRKHAHVRLRGTSSDWVDVAGIDTELCLALFEQAVQHHRAAPDQPPAAPPQGAKLARRRRFH